MKFILISVFLVAITTANGQENKHESYSHLFWAKVIDIDTVVLEKDSSLIAQSLPLLAQRIKLKFVQKEKGKYSNISKFILIPLNQSDHSCSFNFVKEKQYKIFASATRYSSDLIKKMYRRHFFILDCRNLPKEE